MKTELVLSEKKYFELFIGKRILKSEIFRPQGNIPIYSANVFKPFGLTDKSNIVDFSNDFILWGIDGNFEFNIMRKGTVFATTDHCGTIKILDEKIVAEYLLYQLILKSHILGYDRTLRPSLNVMERVSIDIPVNSHGEFDINIQNELAAKYKKINEIKSIVRQRTEELKEASISIDPPKLFKRFSVDALFNFPETNSGMTKDFCERNKGAIPVYGCSDAEDSVLGFIKESIAGIKYYRDSLTWNRNGSVGKFFYRKGIFSTNEDHRVLELKKEFFEKIDLLYIRFVLENEVKEKGFSFTNKLGKSKIIEIEITLPVDKNGNILLGEQILLKEKFERIKALKEKLLQEAYTLDEITVEL